LKKRMDGYNDIPSTTGAICGPSALNQARPTTKRIMLKTVKIRPVGSNEV